MALYSPQEIVEMLEKGPLTEIYNKIFYTVYRKQVTYKYGYAKADEFLWSTKIGSMAFDWKALLKKDKNAKHLLTDVVQVFT